MGMSGELKLNADFILKRDPLKKKIYLDHYFGKEKVVKIPDGVTDITSFAFSSFHNESEVEANNTMEEIILPDSVNIIETEAFAGCTALKKIRWPENESLMDTEKDYGLLATLKFFEPNLSYDIIDGWLVNKKNKTVLMRVFDDKAETSIPDGIENNRNVCIQ